MAVKRKFSRGNGGKETSKSVPAPSVQKPKTAGKEKKGNKVTKWKDPIRSGRSVKE